MSNGSCRKEISWLVAWDISTLDLLAPWYHVSITPHTLATTLLDPVSLPHHLGPCWNGVLACSLSPFQPHLNS